MAFYRVTIWDNDGKVSQGIRELDNTNIDYATNYFRGLAMKAGLQVYDIEAAMLSNKCTAVRVYMDEKAKKRRTKFSPPKGDPFAPVNTGRRKDQYDKPGPALIDRKNPT